MALSRLLALPAAVVLLSSLPALAQDGATPEAPATTDAPAQTAKPAPKRMRLSVGDPAPKIDQATWVKGSPVESWEAGKVYVLDFWATWCGPCRRSIPELAKTAKEYESKNVHVIGLAVWPRDGMVPTKKFVEQMGDGMPYTIAEDIDDKIGNDFMRAAGQNGIPTMMIVDQKGTLAWIGHPGKEFTKVLDKVVAGKFDAVAYETHRTELMTKAGEINKRLQTAAQAEDWSQCLSLFDEFLALDAEEFSAFHLYKYDVLATKMKDVEAAKKHGRAIVDGPLANDAMMLNALAWFISDPSGQVPKENRDYDLAQLAAEKARDLTKGEDATILDTLARVKFAKGDINGAIETQTAAVNQADEDGLKAELQKTLDEFKKKAAAG